MGDVRRLERMDSRSAREVLASSSISFGTDAPYSFGAVGFGSIGFADIPVVGVTAMFRERDRSAMIAPVMQRIFRAVEDAGVNVGGLRLSLSTSPKTREGYFVDENPASASHRKRKRGKVWLCHLEIEVRGLVSEYREALPRWYRE